MFSFSVKKMKSEPIEFKTFLEAIAFLREKFIVDNEDRILWEIEIKSSVPQTFSRILYIVPAMKLARKAGIIDKNNNYLNTDKEGNPSKHLNKQQVECVYSGFSKEGIERS